MKVRPASIVIGLAAAAFAGGLIGGTSAYAQSAKPTRITARDPWVLQTPFGIMYSKTARETGPDQARGEPGTIIVHSPERYLYYGLGPDQALRYSIAVG